MSLLANEKLPTFLSLAQTGDLDAFLTMEHDARLMEYKSTDKDLLVLDFDAITIARLKYAAGVLGTPSHDWGLTVAPDTNRFISGVSNLSYQVNLPYFQDLAHRDADLAPYVRTRHYKNDALYTQDPDGSKRLATLDLSLDETRAMAACKLLGKKHQWRQSALAAEVEKPECDDPATAAKKPMLEPSIVREVEKVRRQLPNQNNPFVEHCLACHGPQSEKPIPFDSPNLVSLLKQTKRYESGTHSLWKEIEERLGESSVDPMPKGSTAQERAEILKQFRDYLKDLKK